MPLSNEILKKINKVYLPSELITIHWRGQDMVLKTNEKGNAIQMFIGKINEKGTIKGERYSRKMVYDKDSKLIKDHWERKGKAS